MEQFETRWVSFTVEGHANIKATHTTTLELTKENYLTPRGDCIIGINSEIALADLPEWLKQDIWSGKRILLVVCVDNLCDSIIGYGDPGLTLSDQTRIIIRRSNYKDHKTLMIRSNKSAKDIDRKIIEKLRQGKKAKVYITAF